MQILKRLVDKKNVIFVDLKKSAFVKNKTDYCLVKQLFVLM